MAPPEAGTTKALSSPRPRARRTHPIVARALAPAGRARCRSVFRSLQAGQPRCVIRGAGGGAGAAGDAIAQVYATAVAERTTLRLALATRGLKRVIRVQALVRARSIRAGIAQPDPTPLSSRGGRSGLGLVYNRSRAGGRRARGPGFAAALIQRAWRCLQARVHLLLLLHGAGGAEAVAPNLICYDTLGPAAAQSWMAPPFRQASGAGAETTRAGGPRKRVVRGSCATTANIAASARSRLLDSATSEGTKRTYGSAFGPW